MNDVAPPVKQICCALKAVPVNKLCCQRTQDVIACSVVYIFLSFHTHSTYKRAGKASSGPTALMKRQEASNAVIDMLSGAALTGSVLEEPESAQSSAAVLT